MLLLLSCSLDIRGYADFIRGSSGGTDSATEDYSVVAAAQRIQWDNRQLLSIWRRASSAVADRGWFCAIFFRHGGSSMYVCMYVCIFLSPVKLGLSHYVSIKTTGQGSH